MTYGNLNVDTITTSTTGGVLGAGNASIMKNRIINGAMVIDQRNAGASVSVIAGTTKRTVDMFGADIAGGIDGVFTMQQSTTVPTAGYKNSVVLTVTTANTSSSSGRYYRFFTGIEGFNIADWNSGSATAATVTLSFWVRSSITGTYCVGFQNATFNRSYAANYTINVANTWEQKSITLTLDTTGTWASDNTAGLKLFWDLGSGSSFQQTANTWAASNTWLTSNQTNWINTNGATLYLAGVQLEVGSSATGYEYRQYGQELALCQRYYNNYGVATTTWFVSTTVSYGAVTFPVMRVAPTVVGVSGTQQYGPGGQLSATVAAYGATGTTYTGLSFTQSGGGTTNAGGFAWGGITLSSEL
jgi:hypothetical protein